MIAKTKAKPIAMDLIRRSKDVQPRAELDDATVEEYAELLRANKREWPFPPVVVFDDGDGFWLASGFHRVAAAEIVDRATVMAEVHKGDQRDAILYAAGTNAEHGRRRSNEDKRFIVRRLLEDDEWSQRSQRWIAERCKVSAPFVASIKESIVNVYNAPPDSNGGPSSVKTRDGRTYPASREEPQKTDRGKSPSGGTSFDPGEWEEPGQPEWDKLAEIHRHAVNDLNRINREFEDRARREEGAYCAIQVTRICKSIHDAKVTIRQLEPVDEVDGKVVTRIEQESRKK